MNETCSIQHMDDAPRVPFDLDGRILFSSDKLELIHLTLKPGEEVGFHTQPFDVLFYVSEGDGFLRTENKELTGTPGTLMKVTAGVQRSLKNPGTIAMKILVIKLLK